MGEHNHRIYPTYKENLEFASIDCIFGVNFKFVAKKMQIAMQFHFHFTSFCQLRRRCAGIKICRDSSRCR